ncbi:MAG: CRISPR-associated endonuclease Cas2 [Myxococcota bacterium]
MTLICYDIADPKRLRTVFEICRRFGDHLQYSIFVARLSDSARAELVAELTGVIHHRDDRVLLIRIGPDGRETMSRFEGLGRQGLPGSDDDGFPIY